MLKKISAIVIPTIIAVGIIGYMLARVWDDLLIALEHAVYSYLIVAVVICAAAWMLRGARYQYILKNLEIKADIWLSTACIYVSQTANLIIPARLGDLVRLFILKHEVNATYSNGLSSLVVERFFDIILVAVLGAVSLPFVLNVPDWFITVIILPIIAGGVFILFVLYSVRLKSENKYLKICLGLLNEVKKASLNPRALSVLSISSIVIWIMDVAICMVIAMMFGQEIPFAVIVLAIVIGNLVKAVPITPGGVGTYELSVALTLELSGIMPAVATLIAVIDHLVKNLVTLAGGIVSMYFFGDWSVQLVKRAFSSGLDTGDLKIEP